MKYNVTRSDFSDEAVRPMAWIPHGTVGRGRSEHAASRPAWRLPLNGYVNAAHPLTLAEAQEDQVWVREWINDKREVSDVVASPFQPYPGHLRGYQGYLTKMPLDFVNRWPKLKALAERLSSHSYLGQLSAELQDDDAVLTAVVEEIRQRKGGQGFRVSPKAQRAIEDYSVQRARKHYEDQGYSVEVRGKPYDLLCSKAGAVLHVEVKGTTTAGDEILLTPNEVDFASKNLSCMALFIVSGVDISLDDPPVASGGAELEIRPWTIHQERLTPIGYAYKITVE